MSTHTPGPWEWSTSNSWRRLSSPKGDGDVMYPCVQRYDNHPDVTFPNGGVSGPDARLIAAAPELLEALKLIEETAHIGRGSFGPEWACQDVMRLARAAIAKATGEQA